MKLNCQLFDNIRLSVYYSQNNVKKLVKETRFGLFLQTKAIIILLTDPKSKPKLHLSRLVLLIKCKIVVLYLNLSQTITTGKTKKNSVAILLVINLIKLITISW